ncbi:MAG TPA: polyprenyl synthetase family protein [Actinopolymorphaceae bacterium]
MNTVANLLVPFTDTDLERRIRRRLEEVEARMASVVASDNDFVTEAARHLIEAGGKRFRPLLVLLGAEFGDPEADGIVTAAAVVELTHLATLYHDDVMDDAPLRRGAPSANARWSNTVAILTGDYLFARASDIMTELSREIVRIQARTFARLVEGQLRETQGPAPGEDPLEHYLDVLADKTGSLIATSARFGAKLSGADDEIEQIVTEFGERIGVAFQLSDDVLDVASETAQSGKTPGTDLREGIHTLPVLLATRTEGRSRPEDERLRELVSGPLEDDDAHAEALALLRAHPALTEARKVVQQWADDARAVLAGLPDIPARAALTALCDIVVTRTG